MELFPLKETMRSCPFFYPCKRKKATSLCSGPPDSRSLQHLLFVTRDDGSSFGKAPRVGWGEINHLLVSSSIAFILAVPAGEMRGSDFMQGGRGGLFEPLSLHFCLKSQ